MVCDILKGPRFLMEISHSPSLMFHILTSCKTFVLVRNPKVTLGLSVVKTGVFWCVYLDFSLF